MFKSQFKFLVNRRGLHDQSGMTMIELLVSLGMVGMLLVLFAASFNIVVLTKKVRNENIAYHVANKRMETLRSVPFASLPTSAGFFDSSLNDVPNSSASYVIQDYPSFSGVKEMIVTVQWNDGRARSVVLRSVTSASGIQP
jgi:prepilin-type N-terminal cleavage/methylation domain-containing protein